MNLLTDPLLRVRTDRGLESMSLPALLAALGRDRVDHLVGIQRHQDDAFHVFLCYLAGAVLARRHERDPVQGEDFWRDGLASLAGDDADAVWTLIVDDVSRPAFMQPPLPDAPQPTSSVRTPDGLDLLQTAKNHDVKQERAGEAGPDDWIYALISLQTMSGFSGSGNYGISRMNSGFGNRPIVELMRSPRPGHRWQDATLRLLQHRQDVLAGPYGFDPNGLVLVWLEPWDGHTSLDLARLDPFYVEICRRVRLRGGDRVTSVDRYRSWVPRIAAQPLKGVVGDAWLPVDVSGSGRKESAGDRALTVSAQGLTPDLLRRLIFADGLRLTALQRPGADWQGEQQLWLGASVLIRGQGTTDGFHEQLLPIPGPMQRRLFGPRTQGNPLATLSKNAIDHAGRMQGAVLRPAVFAYLQGAPDQLKFDRDAVQAWWGRAARSFEALWAVDYFPWLWTVPEPFDEEAMLQDWARRLRDHALRVLRDVQQALPQRQGRTYRARVQAERTFWRALHSEKNFPFLREERHDHVAGG